MKTSRCLAKLLERPPPTRRKEGANPLTLRRGFVGSTAILVGNLDRVSPHSAKERERPEQQRGSHRGSHDVPVAVRRGLVLPRLQVGEREVDGRDDGAHHVPEKRDALTRARHVPHA